MRTVTTFILILLALSTYGRKINFYEAQEIANEFFNTNNRFTSNSSQVKVRPIISTIPSQMETQPFYIFNVENGFVIISGDTSTKKILGYSESSCFDPNNIPPQLAEVLQQYAIKVNQLPEDTISDPSWLLTMETSEGLTLETALWGQEYPFNIQCPTVNGVHAPTGCVATALAIIMKYHHWPVQGRDSHTYYWKDEPLSFDYASTTFDWDSMPSIFNEQTISESQIQEVSKLMRGIGNAVNMQYDSNMSGSYPSAIPYNMYRYFKYFPPRVVCNYETQYHPELHSDEEWMEIIKNEIDNNRPVIYSARSSEIGHTFVVDGYDNEFKCHVNWGWGGIANGYFAIKDFLGYVLEPELLIGMTPDKESDNNPEKIFVDDGRSIGLPSLLPINLNYSTIERRERYTGDCRIYTSADFNESSDEIQIGCALVDELGTIKQVASQSTQPLPLTADYDHNIPSVAECDLYFSFYTNIQPTDKIVIVWKKNTESTWHTIASTHPDIPNYVPAANNQPDCIQLDITCDEGIEIFAENYENYFDGNISQVMKRVSASENICAKSEFGFAKIFVDGENANLWSENGHYSYAPFWRNKNHEIAIHLIRYDEMYDLALDIEAGSIQSLITPEEAHSLRSLKLTGTISNDDLYYLRDNCWVISKIDLADVKIAPDNFIPEYAFANEGIGLEIILPKELKGFRDRSMHLSKFNSLLGTMKWLEIPASVTDFEGLCFGGEIYNLIVRSPKPENYHSCVILNPSAGSSTLWVPEGCKDIFRNSALANGFWNIEELQGNFKCPSSLTAITTNIELPIGESIPLEVSVEPTNSNYVNSSNIFIWWSATDNIEVIQNIGDAHKAIATANNKGQAVVFARMDPYQYSVTFNINVLGRNQEITWTDNFDSIHIGDEINLNAKSSSGLDITYEIIEGNNHCILIDSHLITTSIGSIEIEATQRGNDIYEAAIPVRKTIDVKPILAESVTLSTSELLLNLNESTRLIASVLPYNTTDPTIIWSNSDPTVVQLSDSGDLHALKSGNSIITATCGDVYANCFVTVQDDMSGVNNIESTVDGHITIITPAGLIVYSGLESQRPSLSAGVYFIKYAGSIKKLMVTNN